MARYTRLMRIGLSGQGIQGQQYESGLDFRFWTRKESKEARSSCLPFTKRLKTRRIFRNLESFVGGRVREGDYITSVENQMITSSLQSRSISCGWVSNSLVHSLRALSTFRRSSLRTASTAAKPCQGDSSEFYLITGRIPMVAAAGKRHIDS
ncbi:hypothetical protein Tco_0821958 [Tanacetum coccineum]|uniref:Uncharacterized protein n=1 Tax=Tanacetum coccineum TaxID=301880 RepID=A0ABQ5AIJ8_9ASTR